MADKEDNSKENRKRMMTALAILLGLISNKDDYSKLTKEQVNEVKEVFEKRQLQNLTDVPERLDERTIQIQAAEQGISDNVEYYKIVGVEDDRTCPDCSKWQGKTVSMNPNTLGIPTVQDFINGHGFHPNCRCSLQETTVKEIPRKHPKLNSSLRTINSNTYFKL